MSRKQAFEALAATLIWGLCPHFAQAGTLYALFNPAPSNVQLGVLDPSSGAASLLGTPIPAGITSFAAAFDFNGRRVFFVGPAPGGVTRIFSVNTVDGSLISAPMVGEAFSVFWLAYSPSIVEIAMLSRSAQVALMVALALIGFSFLRWRSC